MLRPISVFLLNVGQGQVPQLPLDASDQSPFGYPGLINLVVVVKATIVF